MGSTSRKMINHLYTTWVCFTGAKIQTELLFISFNCVYSRSGVIEKMEALELENQEKMEVEESGRSGARQGRSEHRRFHREVCVFWILMSFFFFFFNNVQRPTRFAKTREGWKNILWWHRCELSTGPAGFALLPCSLFFPFTLACPLPSISLSPCPVFVLCVGQRSPQCGVHFQSPFRAGNPPGDAASLSQLILFAGLFNTVKCLAKSSQIRRMTTCSVSNTASSAYLCVVFTDALEQHRRRVFQARCEALGFCHFTICSLLELTKFPNRRRPFTASKQKSVYNIRLCHFECVGLVSACSTHQRSWWLLYLFL